MQKKRTKKLQKRQTKSSKVPSSCPEKIQRNRGRKKNSADATKVRLSSVNFKKSLYRAEERSLGCVNLRPAARESQEAGFTQPRDHLKADPCIGESSAETAVNFYHHHNYSLQLPPKEEPQTCDKCGLVLKSLNNLRHHIKAIHDNLREFKCDHPGCDREFVGSSALKK